MDLIHPELARDPDWEAPNVVECFLGALVDQQQLGIGFVSDARRLLGEPYESHEIGSDGGPVIRRPLVDMEMIVGYHKRLLAAGWTVALQTRSYRIERNAPTARPRGARP